MAKTIIVAAAAAWALSGCASINGPRKIDAAFPDITAAPDSGATPNALAPVPRPIGKVADPKLAFMKWFFATDFVASYNDRTNATKAGAMLSSGFLLITANCQDFFDGAARDQRRVNVIGDLVAPVTNIVTGLLTLGDLKDHPDRTKDRLEILSLVSNATNAGLNIYEQRFLFGAENMDGVRTLTLNTLADHRQGVIDDIKPQTFDEALLQLFDNEAICKAPHILTMVRAAIRNGQLENAPNWGKPDEGDGNGSGETGDTGKQPTKKPNGALKPQAIPAKVADKPGEPTAKSRGMGRITVKVKN
ncbi:hypothetical protein FPZ24_14225 [Sphingomonas panacisoli]|uniref:Uncharacterized protein n=1 Tax=Sphingomonas panacisoli TaxID=1813879 RepID=A0A5B8LLN7_9SPHN|nr:hypothetical protein [Sphingomonas panacisoli]QDZ08484.1 hypothetical protein FPZ24_14225 [Sphingomonas panacisoli]